MQNLPGVPARLSCMVYTSAILVAFAGAVCTLFSLHRADSSTSARGTITSWMILVIIATLMSLLLIMYESLSCTLAIK